MNCAESQYRTYKKNMRAVGKYYNLLHAVYSLLPITGKGMNTLSTFGGYALAATNSYITDMMVVSPKRKHASL